MIQHLKAIATRWFCRGALPPSCADLAEQEIILSPESLERIQTLRDAGKMRLRVSLDSHGFQFEED